MSAILKELVKAIGSKGKQKEGESDAKYRARLVRLANEIGRASCRGRV